MSSSPHITASDHYLGEMHETFRDTTKNMYRSSYHDMVHGREISVKSDLPSGYGGHVPSLRHDVLFRNTAFDRTTQTKRNDTSRDAFPSFEEQISGIPSYTSTPRGPKKTPTARTIPSLTCSPPWAVTLPLQAPPTHRTQVPSGWSTDRSHATMNRVMRGLDL